LGRWFSRWRLLPARHELSPAPKPLRARRPFRECIHVHPNRIDLGAHHWEGGAVLDPPSPEDQASLSPEEAAGKTGFPIASGSTVTLVLLTTPEEQSDSGHGLAHEHQLAWDYHLTGCFNDLLPPPGASPPPSCLATQSDTFVDAITGAFLDSFTY
jgi:hypothetical protein